MWQWSLKLRFIVIYWILKKDHFLKVASVHSSFETKDYQTTLGKTFVLLGRYIIPVLVVIMVMGWSLAII